MIQRSINSAAAKLKNKRPPPTSHARALAVAQLHADVGERARRDRHVLLRARRQRGREHVRRDVAVGPRTVGADPLVGAASHGDRAHVPEEVMEPGGVAVQLRQPAHVVVRTGDVAVQGGRDIGDDLAHMEAIPGAPGAKRRRRGEAGQGGVRPGGPCRPPDSRRRSRCLGRRRTVAGRPVPGSRDLGASPQLDLLVEREPALPPQLVALRAGAHPPDLVELLGTELERRAVRLSAAQGRPYVLDICQRRDAGPPRSRRQPFRRARRG